jgi:HK97 family phage prohead protease
METKRIARPFELKALEQDGSFSGYGSVFGNLDSYADIVAPGAFKKTLREHKKAGTMPALLWQHKPDSPIGVYTAMKEDEQGLYVEGNLALKTPLGLTAYELLKIKAITGLSIGYETKVSTYDDKKKTRTLTEVDLWEVSLVTFPANTSAMVDSVKSDDIKTIREFEDFLRDAGFSNARAKAIASHGFKAQPEPRDEDELAQLLSTAKRYASAFAPKS